MRTLRSMTAVAAIGGLMLGIASQSQAAITFDPAFAPFYTAADLGSVPGLPFPYGGLTLMPGDPSTLLIGGTANVAAGNLHTIGVVRDLAGHIVGFSGTAKPFGTIGEFNDGGVAFHPSGVLFTAQWPENKLGQTKPGSLDENRVDALAPHGIGSPGPSFTDSISALTFVSAGFPGAGGMRVVTWSDGKWYAVVIAPDGTGTFDIVSATQIDLDPIAPGIQRLPGGPEGFVYVDAANPGFGVDSLLVSDFSDNTVSVYDLDAGGNPLVATRRKFLSGLVGPEGAFIDPLTGDFLFSTFGDVADRVVVIRGFFAPAPVPEPATLVLLGTGLLGLGLIRRHRRAA